MSYPPSSHDDPIGFIAGRLSADSFAPDEDELRQISLRLPPERLAIIDVIASNANLSRNAIINQLLNGAIRDLLDRLPDSVTSDIIETLSHVTGE